jgi:hypothetical protein
VDPTDLTEFFGDLPSKNWYGCVFMKSTSLGFGIITLLIVAVALAGCSGTTNAPASTGGQATQASSGGQATQAASGSSSGPVDASSLFGASYNWVEYKTVTGSGDQKITVYMKWTKEGKCTMRFEGAGAAAMQGMPTEMDCSSTGSTQSQSNPTEVKSDVKWTKVGTESITVGAGTFLADKYTATMNGVTATYWVASGKPLLKMQSGNAEGTATTELNGWG